MTALASAPRTRFAASGDTAAPAPAEERGLARDGVRLMVATRAGVTHARFRDLPDHLGVGDLLVVNNSATLAAEVDGVRTTGPGGPRPVVVHCATHLDDDTWVVELRTSPDAARAVLDAEGGERVELAAGTALTLLDPYPRAHSSPVGRGNRLWRARVQGVPSLTQHLLRHGRPIAYGYLDRPYPLAAYQTVFSSRPGSAEMPSAARPFTDALVSRLVSRGISLAAVTLHTGVSSQEAGEAPQPEWFEVLPHVADQVNATLAAGRRVVAVGTTVTRAVESAVAEDGRARASRGWTERVISPDEPARAVSGLVTGWHDPEASHLLLVESVAGPVLTQQAYDAAVAHGYLWHEFGDSALLLP